MLMRDNPEDVSHSWFSVVLVGTQFLLIGLMILAGPLWPNEWSARGVLVLGLVSGLWSFFFDGFGKHSRVSGNS